MLKSIHLQGFKGFKDTKIDPIRKVNLILGGQNVGKTSLLEAVYFGGANSILFQNLPSVFRRAEGRDVERYWEKNLKGIPDVTLASKYILRTTASENVLDDNDWWRLSSFEFRSLVRRYAFNFSKYSNLIPDYAYKTAGFFNDLVDPLPISLHTPEQLVMVQLLDKVVMARKKRKLIDMLRGIDPRVEDIHSLSPDGELRIYVELDGEDQALPLPQLGHGFSRVVYLYCSLLEASSKLTLIDEVENGIHYSSLPIVFKGIQDIATNNGVQTLITTHSWEAIRAAYNVFVEADALDDFQLIRLERDGDNVRAVVINDEQLVTAMESGYEIR